MVSKNYLTKGESSMKKFLCLIPLLSLTSCGTINETMQAMEANKQAIDMSTNAIEENRQAISEANRSIEENRRQLEAINKTLKKVGEQ
jgi:hypothetical protein